MTNPDPVAGRIGDDLPAAPTALSDSAFRLWRDAVTTFQFARSELALLESALRAWDRAEEARAVVEEEGISFTNQDSGMRHVHPAVRVEAEARREFWIAWRTLGLVDSEGK